MIMMIMMMITCIYIYMLTQAFQCFAKEADGARSPFFVHRPPKVKSSNAAPRSASMQRPKDGEELRKVEARSTIVAAYSRMGPSCKQTNHARQSSRRSQGGWQRASFEAAPGNRKHQEHVDSGLSVLCKRS